MTVREFDNLYVLKFDYQFTQNNSKPLSFMLDKAKALHEFLTSVRALSPEDMVIPEELARDEVVNQKIGGYDILVSRLTKLDGLSSSTSLTDELLDVTLEIYGKKVGIKVEDNKIKTQNDHSWDEVSEIGIQYAAIDKLISTAVSLLQKNTGGKAMPVFPPFALSKSLSISGDTDLKSTILNEYAKVRKNVAKMMRVVAEKENTSFFSDFRCSKKPGRSSIGGNNLERVRSSYNQNK